MRKSIIITAKASLTGLAIMTLAACDSEPEATSSDEDTAVTNVDPGEGDGTINDTTLIDGTIGAEEAMGMESRMPPDVNTDARSAAQAASAAPEAEKSEEDAPKESMPEPAAPAPAPAEYSTHLRR